MNGRMTISHTSNGSEQEERLDTPRCADGVDRSGDIIFRSNARNFSNDSGEQTVAADTKPRSCSSADTYFST